MTRGVWREEITGFVRDGSLKMSSIPTAKMGTGSGHSRPGTSQAESKRCAVSLGKPRNPAGLEYRLCKCKEEGEAGEGPRTGNDLFFIHEETL